MIVVSWMNPDKKKVWKVSIKRLKFSFEGKNRDVDCSKKIVVVTCVKMGEDIICEK